MKIKKIKTVTIDNRKKLLVVETAKEPLSLPFQWLEEKPAKLKEAFVEKDIGNEGITYTTEKGERNTVHIDLFLSYNRDPELLRQQRLYMLTLQLQKRTVDSGLSLHEIARQMKTSRMQIHRLLDQSNYKKTFDSLFRLAFVVGVDLQWTLQVREDLESL